MDRSEGGGKAHVAEWRRVGAKRVLGDVGRGGGSVPRANICRWCRWQSKTSTLLRRTLDGVSAAMSPKAASRERGGRLPPGKAMKNEARDHAGLWADEARRERQRPDARGIRVEGARPRSGLDRVTVTGSGGDEKIGAGTKLHEVKRPR